MTQPTPDHPILARFNEAEPSKPLSPAELCGYYKASALQHMAGAQRAIDDAEPHKALSQFRRAATFLQAWQEHLANVSKATNES